MFEKIKTAYQSKLIAGIMSGVTVLLMSSFSLDIQPVIAAVETGWVQATGIVTGILAGITAIGADKQDE